ncbi:DUF748 domain-containing protein [Sulfurimonas sp.]
MFNKIKKVLLFSLVIYAFVGFIVLPLVLKPQLIKFFKTQTNAKIEISSIYFNPFLFKLKVSGLNISDKNNNALLSLKSIFLDIDVYSLLFSAIHIHSLKLDTLKINLVRNKDKSINLLNILKKAKELKVEKKENNSSFVMPRIIIDYADMSNAVVHFSDYTIADVFKFDIKNMGLRIKNIDTKENNKANGTLRFYATFEDEGFIDFKTSIKKYKPLVATGSLDFEANKLYSEWKYVKGMLNIEVADGRIYLHSEYAFNSSDINATKIKHTTVEVRKLRLKPKMGRQDILSLKYFALKDINAQPLKNIVNIPEVQINGLNVKITRNKDKSIDWTKYVQVKTKDAKEKPNAVDKNTTKSSLALFVKKVSLTTSNITFKDKALVQTVQNSINDINVNIYSISTKKGSWLKYSTNFKVNHKGVLSAKGKLRATPLKEEGSFSIKDLSLKEITPYLQENAYVEIEDGLLSAKGYASYEKSKKAPDLRLNGSLNLNSIFINNTLDKSLLFSLSSLDVKNYTLELFPHRLYVNKVDINSFYVNAEIDKNKVMNFSKLSKNVREKIKKIATNKEKEKPFPYKIDKIKVALGSAKFQDYSIPLKFKTNIHNLNGVIYSITNMDAEHTLINLDGDIDKYGSTRIKGSLDSQNPKVFTNIDMNFKNLELSAMSGYSASFAGYEIDSGKLFLDLGYDIVNSRLHGTNNVVIKKIKLGKEVVDDNGSSLPLGFVIGLLEDDKGVIDIDMPVDGNLDKPDFKYGKLVWNTFTNLVTRAVSAPFKFLGSMLGLDAKDIEYVEFESGRAKISPMQREKLDTLAEIMKKRPKLGLSVAGVYDKRSDKLALQKEKLIALVLKKSGLKNKKEHQSAMTVGMLEEIYNRSRKNDTLKELKIKLAKNYKGEEFTLTYRKKLIALCTSIMKVKKKELVNLGNKRAVNIINYLVSEKNIAQNRLEKDKVKDRKSSNKFIKIELKLDVK